MERESPTPSHPRLPTELSLVKGLEEEVSYLEHSSPAPIPHDCRPILRIMGDNKWWLCETGVLGMVCYIARDNQNIQC